MKPRPEKQGIAKMLQPFLRQLLIAGMGALFAAVGLGGDRRRRRRQRRSNVHRQRRLHIALGQGRPQQVAGHRPAARRPRHPRLQSGHRRRGHPHAAAHLRHRRRRRPVQRHRLRSRRPADRRARARGRARFVEPLQHAAPPDPRLRHHRRDRQRQHRSLRLGQERRRRPQGAGHRQHLRQRRLAGNSRAGGRRCLRRRQR